MTLAAVLTEPRKPLDVCEVEIEEPGPNEIRVRIAASGVCHSDYHVYERGVAGLLYPCVLGHEASGVVDRIGEGVENASVGDHVVLCVVPQCGVCSYCQRGDPTQCVQAPKTRYGALPGGYSRVSLNGQPVGQVAGLGTWSEEVTISAMSAVVIDKTMPLVPAALLGCGVVTGYGAVTNVARVREGESMAVIGCGGLGLNAIQAGRIAGAERIIGIDLSTKKLELARTMGATDLVDASTVDVYDAIAQLTHGEGVDASFDFVVTRATAKQALGIARRGGVAVLTGFAEETLEFPVTDIIRSGRTIKGNLMGMGSFRVDFPKLINLYQEGRLLLDPLISRTFKLEDANSALAALSDDDVARSVFVL